MNLKRLKSLLNNDEQLVNRFIGVFKKETPKQLASLGVALKSKKLNEVSLIAHAIKSQLRYMGLDQLASLAEQLEKGAEGNAPSDKLKLDYTQLHFGIKRIINSLE